MLSFWKGRRVFLSGHTGFKGAWMMIWLRHLGAEVTGYALDPPTQPSLFVLARAGEGVTDLRGDVRDAAALGDAVASAQPEIILHFAAQALVRASYEEPVETFATNVLGTVHLLEAARKVSTVKAVVVVTSDKCYENREWQRGYREDDPMGGFDPYSASKGCAELVAAAYRRSFFQGLSVATARAGNVLGGGDWANDRLVPDLVRAFQAGRRALIRNPLATRPWQHVLEPLFGYLKLAQRVWEGDPQACEGWNFGPEEASTRSVGWVADEAARHWGQGAAWGLDPAAHPHEARALSLDNRKAREALGWKPLLGVEQALAWTLQCYRGLQDGRDARDLVLGDILAYEERLKTAQG
jgi:CDP-glucose 4,6-dehydratase